MVRVGNTIAPVDNANHQVGDKSTENSDANEDEGLLNVCTEPREQNRVEARQDPAHSVDQDPNPTELCVLRAGGSGFIHHIIGAIAVLKPIHSGGGPEIVLALGAAYVAGGWQTRFQPAVVAHVTSPPPLVFSLLTPELRELAATFALFVSGIGYLGRLLNNRPFLAVYTFLLWIAFGLLVVPGYITYKRRTLNLEAKVNQKWSQELGAASRLTIQCVLGCCGILPGCKQQFLEFQEKALTRWYIVSFGLVPVHIAIMAAGLLCSNHVTYRFGMGMMPKAYRLSREAMAVIMEQYASQLADQYGADAAAHMIANNSGNTGPRMQTHTRGTGSGLSGLGSGSGSGGYAQMPPNPFSPNPTPAASASDLNLAGPRPHEDGDEEGDGYSYGYGGVEEGDERGAGGQHAKYESLDIGAERGF
ncbi:hypothetical protein B0H16DRAFT_1473680 [Mycena metata]|uniref:Uncharacterized protein n=1 Tax=Mycena metata TaxID=1033252 RepID=A0AAD7HK05_9AGAR|nr:hypothetical protein B0H16DRAFT_1473680 [Mycena metata]